MTVLAQPVMSPGHSAGVAEAMALSEYQLTTEEDGIGEEDTDEDEGHGLDDEGHGLDDEGHGLDDEGRSVESDKLGLEGEEEAVPEGQQREVPVVGATVSSPLGLRFGALRRQELTVEEDQQPTLTTWKDLIDSIAYIDILAYPPPAPPAQTSPSPEWSSGSLLVSPAPSAVPSPISSPMISLTVSSPIASPVATPTATIPCLDAMPPTLFASIDRDVRDLYTRLGLVRDEIFSQRYKFKSLKLEQERTAVTFGAL
ncbi:hypothetical protein Tco_0655872 [Tanacetum coccineum]|uniref:Uncharacterized protein n=1 Tax=Tanacetum coccineum TaxID=301880 RepID=A0ABQ4X7S9_9ASTR